MKLKELVAGEEALKVLVSAKFDNVQISWDLADSLEVVEKTIKKFHENRTEYIKKNGKPVEGNSEHFQIEDQEAFAKYMTKLLDVNVKINFPTLTLADVKKAKLKVSPAEIGAWKILGLIAKPKPAVKKKAEVNEIPKND